MRERLFGANRTVWAIDQIDQIEIAVAYFRQQPLTRISAQTLPDGWEAVQVAWNIAGFERAVTVWDDVLDCRHIRFAS